MLEFLNALKFKMNGTWGFSLISLIVALAILGIMIPIFLRYMDNQNAISRKLELRGQREDLRNYIRLGIDCEQTKLTWPSPCKNGQIIELKRNLGASSPLVAAAVGKKRTKVGNYYLQAQCNGLANQYVVYYSTLAEPSTNKASSDVNVLFSTPKVCP